MDDRAFEDLLKSVRDLIRHRRGQPVAGVRVTEVADIEPRGARGNKTLAGGFRRTRWGAGEDIAELGAAAHPPPGW